MAGQPVFTHIHSSSRFDRSAASLEADLDVWMADSSLITLTEMRQDYRAAMLAEKGWRHFVSKTGNNADNCGIAWEAGVWHRKEAWVRKLSSKRWIREQARKPGPPMWATNALLKHVVTGRTLLVSVSHLPNGIQGHWKNPGTDEWAARKAVYTDSMHHWSDLILSLERRHKPDAALIVADWNLNLKEHWVRDYLHSHWKKCGLKRAWVHFPTAGGSLGGNSMIDGSYYGGLEVTDGPHLMARVRSSDHRPYVERFRLTGGLTPGQNGIDEADGHTKPGKAWWGFGDYEYDEMFEKQTIDAEGNTVVHFDFTEPPY
jgi:hypothetical protein